MREGAQAPDYAEMESLSFLECLCASKQGHFSLLRNRLQMEMHALFQTDSSEEELGGGACMPLLGAGTPAHPTLSLHSSEKPQTKEHPRPGQTCEACLGQMPNAAATRQGRMRSAGEWAQYLGPRDYLMLEWVSKKEFFLERVF